MRELDTKRLFIAIEIPAGIKASLLDPARTCRMKGLKWLPPEQLHLTLSFIGDTPAETSGAIRRSLEGLSPWRPFELTVEGCGFFPNGRRPNVLWAGVRESAPLRDLKTAIDLALSKAGIKPEARPFHPHLTIARLKEGFRRESCPQLLESLAGFKPASFKVAAFRLFSSVLLPSGAEHTLEASYESSAP